MIFEKEINWISKLRKRRLESRRVQSELLRNYAFRISRALLCKVLRQLNVVRLRKSRILRKHWHRYERPELKKKLQDWQDYYNEFRPHGSLNGKTPWEKWGELFMQAPYHDEIEAAFDESKERLRLQNYRDDLYWQKLKRSL